MKDRSAPLLEEVDRLLGKGDAIFAVRDTRVALVMGVVHGLRLEADRDVPRETAVAAARAGYALRCVDESPGSPLRALICAIERERADLPHWEAMQIVAWEHADDATMTRFADLVEGEVLALSGDAENVLGQVADAAVDTFGTGTPIGNLTGFDARRAARFGYALRIAEQSLPDDPGRLLSDA